MRKLFLLLVLLAPSLYAQVGVRFGDQSPVTAVQAPGDPILSVSNALISFCNYPANGVPCTNRATTYTDITMSTACPINAQVVLVGTNNCVTTTDPYGNWGVNVPAGTYSYTVTLPNGSSIGPYTATLASGGGGGGGGIPGGSSGQVQYNNTGVFGGFSLAGDCSLTVPNIVCTKTNGVAFAASATTDTTNAANLASGTLPIGRLPAINLGSSGSGGVTGNLPITNLAGGTGASATTWWNGTGAWTTPPSITFSVNSGSSLPSPINCQNGGAFNGLTINCSNPSGGNFQLTLAGTATESLLPATTVFTDVAKTFGAHLYDFSAATLKIPAAAGFTSSATSTFGIDTTAHNLHVFLNASDLIIPTANLGAPWVNGDCGYIVLTGSQLQVGDNGTPCGTGSSTAWSSLTAGTNSGAGTFAASGNTWDFHAATAMLGPVGAGYAPTANGSFGYNSTSNLWAFGQNGSTLTLAQTQAPASNEVLRSYSAATGAFTQSALASGDIPNNAANTTGNAGTSTALAAAPSTCTATQAATGVAASGNATGCWSPANTTLTNVSSVGESLVPSGAFNLGSASLPWNIFASNITFPGSTISFIGYPGSCASVPATYGGGCFVDPNGYFDVYNQASSSWVPAAMCPTSAACTAGIGIPVDTSNPATLLSTDRANYLPWSVGASLALPAITGSFAANFPFVTQNKTAATTLTVTPNAGAGDLIDGLTSQTLIPKFGMFTYSDLTAAPGHWYTLRFPTYDALGSTCGDASHALAWSTSAGFSCQSITGTAAAGGSNTQLQYNNGGALGGVTQWTSNGTTTMTAGATGVLNLSAMAPTTGLSLPSLAGAVPTADSFIGFNTTTHALVSGSNGTTIVQAAAATGTNTATTCSNQFVTAVSAVAAPTCTTDTLASAQHANQGTTTTVLHGNAAGNPSFTSVVSADLNITSSTCTNQFLTAISSGAAGTCTTDTLASAQHANQGTTTTVLTGNAAGNPSWALVNLASMVSGQLPIGAVGSAGLSGTAPISIAATGAISLAGGAGEILAGATPALTYTPTLGVSGTAGTLSMFPASGNFTTTWGSAATASNTILGFATAPTTGDVVKCVTASTTCTLTDAGGPIPSSLANATHKWLNSYTQSTGAFTQTQPADTDLTGTTAGAELYVTSSAVAELATTAYSVETSGATNPSWATPTANAQCFMSAASSYATTTPSFQSCPSGFSNPMTTLGDIMYENATPAAARLAGSTSSTLAVLTQTGTGTVSASPVWTTSTGTGNVVLATSPSLTTPAIGAATGTSLLASGIVDGEAPITLTTSASCTLGTASGCNATAYDSGYTFNQEATAATAITYTLPTAAAGKQYCVSNSYNGSAATTGTLEILTSASGQYIIFTDGTLSATGGYVISGGAAADAACVVGVDSTHWQLYVQRGTWTKH